MACAPPIIYARELPPPRVPILTRLIALGIAAGCLAVLGAAAQVTPSAAGVGSHTGLGLQQCSFLLNTGIPCITCGMTTSFAHFVRGNLAASLYTQPMGTLLAMLAGATIWIGAYIAATGRPVHRLLRLVPGRYYVGPLMGLAVAAWAWKMYIHLAGSGGWG